MRIETITRELFTATELRDMYPDAFERAHMDYVSDAYLYNTDEMSTLIAHAVGLAIGEPTADAYGSGDYPGIPGVTITEWDLDRGMLTLTGTLAREDAPRLPWPESSEHATLGDRDYYRHIVAGDDETTWHMDDSATGPFWDAWEAAIAEGLSAGRAELDYLTSEDAFLDACEANGWEFTQTGSMV